MTNGYLASKDTTSIGTYSDMQVLRSNAGWYIGTTYNNMPGSRESEYFSTKEKAQTALDNFTWEQRPNP